MSVSNSISKTKSHTSKYELDARGLSCPLPLLKAKQQLRDLNSGDILEVITTDQGSVKDFQAFAKLSGHALIEQITISNTYIHVLQKA